LAHKIVDEIDLGAPHILQRHGIDEDGRPVPREDQIVVARLFLDQVVAILETGATAALDADPQRRARRLGFQNASYAYDGAVRHHHTLQVHFGQSEFAATGNLAKNAGSLSQSRGCVSELPRDLLRGGARWRARYASDPAGSRGRFHAEPDDPLRSAFQRDRDRLIHCNAFRRLKGKTQVFVVHEGDHFRTRLTHTLEVAQIARSLARPLGLDEDLAEAVALAHDLGHPPFGHAGERALNAALAGFGGFDHNAQSLRVVTRLERRYPDFDGLNLSWEVLEGLVKHNGPLQQGPGAQRQPLGGGLPFALQADLVRQEFELGSFAALEAQAAAIADDIAYDCHDLEDGIRAGLIGMDQLDDEPIAGPILREIRRDYADLDSSRTMYELIRRVISGLIHDVLGEAMRRLAQVKPESPDEVRRAGTALVGFSRALSEDERQLKRFLMDHVYRHESVMQPVRAAESIVSDLFAAFFAAPDEMPDPWSNELDPADDHVKARRVADYIAGMTDRFALAEHARLFDATPDLG
jgi:dGTPase